jgi:hypothetical protein
MEQHQVIGFDLSEPNKIPSIAETLERTAKNPMVGEARRPSRVRVSDEVLATEIQRAEPKIEVVTAPTPELEDVLEMLGRNFLHVADDVSYFEDGRISPEAIEGFFKASEVFWRTAPWRMLGDGDVLRLDIPWLEVKGACVSIIGALGEAYGFLLFPSFAAHAAFSEQAGKHQKRNKRVKPVKRVDLGTSFLSLNFERGADLPPSMLREAVAHGWNVASANAYPRIVAVDRDGVLRRLTEQDVFLVTSIETALAAFFASNRPAFRKTPLEPICNSFFDKDDREVRITFPYGAWPLFEGERLESEVSFKPKRKPSAVKRKKTTARQVDLWDEEEKDAPLSGKPAGRRRNDASRRNSERVRIKYDEPIEVKLSRRDQELLRPALIDEEYADRLQAVPGMDHLIGQYTLDDLEDMLGYIAAQANHTENAKLQTQLDRLYDRLLKIQRSYDDGSWNDSEVS